MFRKLFSRSRPAPVEAPAPVVEIVPVPAEKPTEEEPRHAVIKLKREPSTALGHVFPQQESSVFRRKQATTLKVPHLLKGYAGLAEHIQALSADINPRRDTAEQWQARLKTLQKLARQLERGEFTTTTGTVSDADSDALLALDRLVTLNKGSGDEQKANRVKTFLSAAKEDHKATQLSHRDHEVALIRGSIESSMLGFQAGIHKYLVQPIGTHTIHYNEPPAPVIAASGLYATIDGILRSDKSDAAKWQSLRHLGQRVKEEDYQPYSRPGHIRPDGLSHTLRDLLKKCADAPLTTTARVALMQEALDQFRPAAEYANWQAELAATTAQNKAEREARILAGEEPPAHDTVAEMNRTYEAEREERARNPRPPMPERKLSDYYSGYGYRAPGPLSLERIDDTAKKATIGMGILSVLGVPAAYMMRPQVPAYTPEPAKTVEQINAEIKEESDKKRDQWFATSDAEYSHRLASISSGASSTPPAREESYRAPKSDYDAPRIPKFVDDRSPEQIAYDNCISSDADLSTCPTSPDILQIEREADERARNDKAAQISPVTPEPQDASPPPISEAPRATPAMISYVNQAFPKLAAAGGRKAEPLNETNVTVNFDIPR